jgi:uncharacterized membrane protein YeaQ/YmgE (transglycosylase-associated protein family)
MSLLFLIIIGAAAGYLATRLMRVEVGLPAMLAVGILGALIGGFVLRVLLALSGVAVGFVGAVLGAMLLIWFYQTYLGRR